MYNITIIATHHSEFGKCNSDELYKILEDINPEVVFEELPVNISDIVYGDSFDKHCVNSILLNRCFPKLPLEVKCIKKYKQNHNIKVIPVDFDVNERLSKYQDEISFMFHTFFKCEEYKKLIQEQEVLIAQEGFHYLNSDRFSDFVEKKEVIENNIIESEIQKDRLFDIYKLFHEEQCDNRENAMLQNIYNYSKENQYNQAVLLIGAGHRKSILKKIESYKKQENAMLNWTFYGS